MQRAIAFLLVLLGVGLHSTTIGQFGNEWINHSLPYWSMPVATEGVYQLTFEQLLTAGVVTGETTSDEVKLYHRGLQQHIWVEDGGDGAFGPGDQLTFYGRPNDGWLDSGIYHNSDNQLHPNYSLFNDTAHYYITVHPGIPSRTAFQSSESLPDLSALPYGLQTLERGYQDTYLIGRQDQYGISLPLYESGEGWGSTPFGLGQSLTTTFATPEVYSGADAPAVVIKSTSAGASLASGNPNHHLEIGVGSSAYVDSAFWGYQANRLTFELAASTLGPTTSIYHKSVNDLGVATDYQSVVDVTLTYPRNWVASPGLWSMDISADVGEPQVRVDMTGLAAGSQVFVTRADLRYRLELEYDGDATQMVVPLTAGGATLLVLPPEFVFSAPDPTPISESGTFTDFSTAVDSAFVLIAPNSLMAAANSYAFYRQSNGSPVLLVSADELYHQFGGGVNKHPLAIRRFIDYLLQTQEVGPAHLFLVGKSIHDGDISSMPGSRQHPEIYAANLLPTWGWPSSDLAYTAGLNGTLYQAAVPTGRISARTGEEVLDYLEKVMAFEAAAPAEWQKRVLHFGGGGNASEQNLFRGYLESYAHIVTDSLYGANVHSFYKSTTDPIQLQLGDSITNLISDGCGLMTFFGHASATGFDQNIDAPSNYSNQGRYPLLLGNSCYTGNIHLADASSTSELFTRVADAGVIGFIAKSDVGIPGYLDTWTERFYKVLFQEQYGTTIGRAMVESAIEVQGSGSVNLANNTSLTFALHGDPSLTLYAREFPDYSITPASVFTLPETITTEVDSFDVYVVINNLGKAINHPVGVELIRTLPNGQDTSLVRELARVFYQDTLQFRLPVDRINGVGDNKLDVFVDYPASLVDEEDDLGNNTVNDWPFYIAASDVLPVYPYPYAILPEPPTHLVVSTGDPFVDAVEVFFELDTVPDYSSTWLFVDTQTSPGGVVLSADLSGAGTMEDGVYYWRTAAQEAGSSELEWRSGSFWIDSGVTGFGQGHSGQFAKNNLTGLAYSDNTLQFEAASIDLKATVYGDPSSNFELLATNYQLGLDVMDYAGCAGEPAFHIAVLDSVSLEPWETNYNGANPQNDFGNFMACSEARARTERYFIFRQSDASEMASMVDLLQNQIPNGNHLLLYTWGYANHDAWDLNAPDLYTVLEDLGFAASANANDSLPFVAYTQMGNPLSTTEMVGSTIDDVLVLEKTLQGIAGSGVMTTPLLGIGDWQEAAWLFESDSPSASATFTLMADAPGGLTNLSSYNTLDDSDDVSISAAPYNNLRLRAALSDPDNGQAVQPGMWRITGNHMPDAAVHPQMGYFLTALDLDAGEPQGFSVAITNPTPVDMDSLVVRYQLSAGGGGLVEQFSRKLAALPSGAVLNDTAWFATDQLDGNYVVQLEVNPTGTLWDAQPEQHRFNNIAIRSFSVQGDHEHPLLDVSFDGRHILDGEIITPTPEVRIALRDQSPFLFMDDPMDTAVFKLFLTSPDLVLRPVYFASGELEFIPADGQENQAIARWTPLLTQDGEYELIVQASDLSGNASGPDYRIHFEVETQQAITQVMNYPNPFTTSTQFVFTLTGAEVPDEVVIQIFTVSGKVVREVSGAELGTLRIGPNITDFSWDGTDQFGDPLATGVYLYRVIARHQGQDLEIRSSGADAYFQKGIGKMYLIRQ